MSAAIVMPTHRDRWRTWSFRAVLCAGVALLLAGSLGCHREDELAIRCLDGDQDVCQRLCTAGRRGKGGCVTLAASLLEMDRPRALTLLRDACDADRPEVCEDAHEALGPPKNPADRETARALLTGICEGSEPVPDQQFDDGSTRKATSTTRCLEAADLWLLDDPRKTSALLHRFCASRPPEQAEECFADARSIAEAVGKSAAGCRAGQPEACGRFIQSMFELGPYEPDPTQAPWARDVDPEYPEAQPKYRLQARWPDPFRRATILAAGQACVARGLDDESLWPSRRGQWGFHSMAVYHYDLEDVPKLRCGFRSLQPGRFHFEERLARLAAPEPAAGGAARAFIQARGAAEAGPLTQEEIHEGIAATLPAVRDCYRTWIQRVEARQERRRERPRGWPPPDLWMVTEHPLYVDTTGRVWHQGSRGGDKPRRPARGWLPRHSPEAAGRLEHCAWAALWRTRFAAHGERSRVTVRLAYSRAPLAPETTAAGPEARQPQ